MRVGTQGLFRPCLKTFFAPFNPARLTAPGSPRMKKDKLHVRATPHAPPPRQLEKIPHEMALFEKLASLILDLSNLNRTTTIPLVRSYYNWSKTWIRLLFLSHTTILPSLRFAVENGNFNSPLPLPSLPKFVTNFPLSSNT